MADGFVFTGLKVDWDDGIFSSLRRIGSVRFNLERRIRPHANRAGRHSVITDRVAQLYSLAAILASVSGVGVECRLHRLLPRLNPSINFGLAVVGILARPSGDNRDIDPIRHFGGNVAGGAGCHRSEVSSQGRARSQIRLHLHISSILTPPTAPETPVPVPGERFSPGNNPGETLGSRTYAIQPDRIQIGSERSAS